MELASCLHDFTLSSYSGNWWGSFQKQREARGAVGVLDAYHLAYLGSLGFLSLIGFWPGSYMGGSLNEGPLLGRQIGMAPFKGLQKGTLIKKTTHVDFGMGVNRACGRLLSELVWTCWSLASLESDPYTPRS